MNTLNLITTGLIATLAVTIVLMLISDQYVMFMAEHGLAFVLVAGVVGLVGAREKTPLEKA